MAEYYCCVFWKKEQYGEMPGVCMRGASFAFSDFIIITLFHEFIIFVDTSKICIIYYFNLLFAVTCGNC